MRKQLWPKKLRKLEMNRNNINLDWNRKNWKK